MKAATHTLAKYCQSFSWTTLSVLASTAITAGFVMQPASAQVTAADTLQPNPQSGEYNGDPFSNNGNGQMNSVFDLIHRASQTGGRTMSEVQEDQRETINSEAEAFRNRQLELLREENSSESSNNPSPFRQN
ncbi:hypothetical protein H6G89_14160 [Oscillatoria sp. FACHB-1407]|uniref:hypothetical protein n=1 Tax=Oscillatoria sp. FACHB-1407 TaxID=2692847 RepID=UPI0016852AFC|nr:hypothetical protein [Oscillatoria sp. FACHB-1407]MBD2462189.1 hypothetical protein [Oscillatoria sp. FACHB-1407]